MSVLQKKYADGNREDEFLLTYLKALKSQHDTKAMSVVAKQIIAKSSVENFMSKDLFWVISAASYEYGTDIFSFLLENKVKIQQMTEPYEYQSVFMFKIYDHLRAFAR